MTPKKTTTSNIVSAGPADGPHVYAFLWRLAEIVQMRRVDPFDPSRVPHYQCNLCLERSADETSEIQHKDGCPVLRLR